MPAEHLLRLLSINPQTLLNSQALLCLLSSLVSYVELRLHKSLVTPLEIVEFLSGIKLDWFLATFGDRLLGEGRWQTAEGKKEGKIPTIEAG